MPRIAPLVAVLSVLLVSSPVIVDRAIAESKKEAPKKEEPKKEAPKPHVGNQELLERVLATQQVILNKLADLGIKVDNLGLNVLEVEAACLPPDLIPVAQAGSFPPNYCVADADGNLLVRVMNQGRTDAPASTARVTFSTPAGPVVVDVPTPAVAGNGGFADLTPIPIPAECFLPANPFPSACNFQIVVDVAGVVAENDENNNTVVGACVPVL
jgi:hypothetical protein